MLVKHDSQHIKIYILNAFLLNVFIGFLLNCPKIYNSKKTLIGEESTFFYSNRIHNADFNIIGITLYLSIHIYLSI